MANLMRGEIAAEFSGKTYTLCLTLGALAELEQRFGVGDLVALAARFEEGRLSSRDLLTILACGLRGAGYPLSDAEVAAFKIPGGLPACVRIAADLMAVTFGDEPGASISAIPPAPQDALNPA